MDNFFKKFAEGPCAINMDKMAQVIQLVKTRDISSGLPLLDFVNLMADRVDEYSIAHDRWEDAPPHLKQECGNELEFAYLKIAVTVCVLAKYFYPVIEQLERLVDDGIKLENEMHGKKPHP